MRIYFETFPTCRVEQHKTKVTKVKVEVNFEIYIADRKATTCILAKLFLLRCVNYRSNIRGEVFMKDDKISIG